ncbi:C2H2-like zinc finger protein [Actinidia rufa]|uniref:C2H2-like zinc finger protein n=1 Tax=Actinidia rufa TaxID=165716 RepID=A0A7J0GXX5_9ERIC|nr:C2H2-like zinc finger protein [Actinidia rufa]
MMTSYQPSPKGMAGSARLLTDTAVSASWHTPSCNLFSNMMVGASRHVPNYANKAKPYSLKDVEEGEGVEFGDGGGGGLGQGIGEARGFVGSVGRVENGEISEKDLRPRRRERGGFVKRGDGSFSVSGFDGEGGGEGNLDSVVDELVGLRTDFHSMEISTFSDGEAEAEENGDYEEDGDFLYDSEDEDSEDDD